MNQISIVTKAEIQGDRLLVSYGVENKADRDVYLLNRVHNKAGQLSPDFAYVELHTADHSVWIYKKIPDLPAGVQMAMPEAPYVTPVRAGKRFAETINLPVPLHEYRAYDPRPADSLVEHPATYSSVRVTVGYYWSVAGMKEMTDKVAGTEVILPQAPPRTRLEFGELNGPSMHLSVPVLEQVSR